MLSNKIDKVISNAFHIITGSPYLTHYVSKLNFNVTEIPTSVSHHNYHNKQIINDNKKFIIGWIGSKTTSVNVIKLIPALEQLSNYIDFQLNLIGFDIELKDKLNLLNVNFINWNAEIEIKEIKKFNVGIMPLENTMFNHGKCGFKLVQYMGCFLPTISSPLEANVKINRNKKNLHATTDDEWLKAFMEIYNNQSYFKEVGVENYNTFINHYTIEKNSQYYLKIFSTVK